MQTQFDVAIVGAGVIGCAIARVLSQYQCSTVVLEKEGDVAFGTSGKNSGVVHAGFNNTPGSLMAKLCVEGNLGFEVLCKELDVPYKKTGKMVIALDDGDVKSLEKLMQNGERNGTPGLMLIDTERMRKLEPHRCV